jgi:DNA polymerase III epsilon subunit-like protein
MAYSVLDEYTILDIEANGLLKEATLIHCLSYKTFRNGKLVAQGSFTDYNSIIQFIAETKVIVGHNIIRYDIPLVEKILGIIVTATLIDTLILSWYLIPDKKFKHGLEAWGERLGIPKPVITDWNNLSVQDYVHRCEQDVEINVLLFNSQLAHLSLLYEADIPSITRVIMYLCYKLDCAKEQEEVKCKIDIDLVNTSLRDLRVLRTEKVDALISAMPRNIKFKKVKRPSKVVKKDGSLSSAGQKWYQLLQDNNLPSDYTQAVMVKILDEEGNPGSHSQLKDWLYSLGWQPITFEFRKNAKDEVNKVPQIYDDDEVCQSIKDLFEIEPALEHLNMLSLIKHRIVIFKAFLKEKDENDYVIASIAGVTNTLRFKHKLPIVNLPKVSKFYGAEIRGSLIAPNSTDYVLCGSDMSSLEDTTKQHYMYFFDPEYVMQMRVPGFDPHLDIALLAQMLTVSEIEEHKLYSTTKGAEGLDHSETRGKAKTVNFAGVYGAGPPKIAQSTGMPLEQAQQLHKTYWDRNKAVKQVSAAVKVKKIKLNGVEQMWLFNPVSKFWYSLRYKKDIFSTLNQGTGVYCFDLWVRQVRSRGIKIMLQYHDEIAFCLLAGREQEIERILLESIEQVNENLKLNVPLGVSVDFGNNYAEIH